MKHWTNARGQVPHKSLDPPDLSRCQAFPNMMEWSPFTLGPKPQPVRCANKPMAVAVQNKKQASDDKIGAMSLCGSCLALFKTYKSPTFAKIHVL